MKLRDFRWLFLGAAGFLWLALQPMPLYSQEQILSDEETGKIVAIGELKVEDDEVAGVLVNNSDRPLKDVQLRIRDTWYWEKEFRPGENPPGEAAYYTVEKEIPPKGKLPFVYKRKEPLPSRPDGRFETDVKVSGFTEVIE